MIFMKTYYDIYKLVRTAWYFDAYQRGGVMRIIFTFAAYQRSRGGFGMIPLSPKATQVAQAGL